MKKYNTNFQPIHYRSLKANLAERAIQTFKWNFKAGLTFLHPDFPITGWDRLL